MTVLLGTNACIEQPALSPRRTTHRWMVPMGNLMTVPGDPQLAVPGEIPRPPTGRISWPSSPSLLTVEQVVAPLDRRSQRPLANVGSSSHPAQEGEAVVEPSQDSSRSQHLDPGSGELDGQGKPVEDPADGRHVSGVRRIELEAGPNGPAPHRTDGRPQRHRPRQDARRGREPPTGAPAKPPRRRRRAAAGWSPAH